MSTPAALPPMHALLALAVVAIWGSNFVVIAIALEHMPPLLFGALRFSFALVPAVFFLPRPAVPWTNLAAYGALIGVGQFGLLYLALRGHISPGLASLVIQVQVFFTIGLAMRLRHERLRRSQWLALALAASGIGVILAHVDGATTVTGLAMVLAGAFSWACGNIVATRAGGVNMLAYVVWSSAFAIGPLLALSLVIEGWPAVKSGLAQTDLRVWAAVLWQAWGNTLFGYAVWAWLHVRHPAALVSPMALLVPVFGMGTAAAVLGEPLPPWKLGAALLVISGLALNVLGPRWRRGTA